MMDIINRDKFIEWFDILFSITNDGLALIDKEGNLLKYNENLEITLSINEKNKKPNIKDYIRNFSVENINSIYETSNNNKVTVKIRQVRHNEEFLYVVCVTEMSKDVILKRLHEAVIYTLTDGIHAADTKGIIRIYNDAYGKLEGYHPSEVLGKNLRDVYKLDEETSLLLQAQKTEKVYNNKRQIYYTKKGNKIDVVTSAFPLYYNKKLIGSAAIVSDFTQMQKLIDRYIEIENKLAEKLKKGDVNSSPYYKFNDIVTNNKELLDVISFAKLAAVNDSNVMIYGETGTGKELFAQSIHTASHRKNKPFMAINCAAIPETLLESLLFGTTKGAFTGAIDKAGLFEQADGGTLFLDEINSMPMMLQSKLLRILETKMVTRLGDNKSIPVDVRIVSSFNENPIEAVEKGIFRNDLFFRLGVVYLSIPPLRNRVDDIDLLCTHFIELYNKKLNKNIFDLTEEVKDLFRKLEWPGNVRQLKNAIESIMNIIGDDNEYIGLQHVPKHIITIDNKMSERKININYNNNINYSNSNNFNNQNSNYNNTFDNRDNEMNIFDKIKMEEYNLIIKYIKQTNGNIAQAAKLMGISRQKLHYKIKKYNIK